MQRWIARAAMMLGACSTTAEPPAAPRALGMNDVTILVPLPTDLGAPVIDKLRESSPHLMPVNLVAGLVLASEIGPKVGPMYEHDDLHVVAVRFDPCSREHDDHVGQCTDDDDGRLRLVLQPLYTDATGIGAHDVALHAFYVIPRADWPAVVDELRALAPLGATSLG